jgi:hypothetical protein
MSVVNFTPLDREQGGIDCRRYGRKQAARWKWEQSARTYLMTKGETASMFTRPSWTTALWFFVVSVTVRLVLNDNRLDASRIQAVTVVSADTRKTKGPRE